MRNYIQKGDNLTFPAPADTESGAPVLIGNLFGIAAHSALAGEPLTIKRDGVYTLAKDPAAVFTEGELVWFDPATKLLGEQGAGKLLVGAAVVVAGNGATSVDVVLAGGVVLVEA